MVGRATAAAHGASAARWRVVAALAASVLFGCGSCAGGVAELLAREGAVERSASGEPSAWADAPVGRRFEIGDAVRTGAGATARLRVGSRGVVHMQASTVLRFLGERPDRTAGVRLEAGEVELDGADGLALETELGAVVLAPGARVVARGGGGEARVQVVAGRVELEQDGETRVVEAGRTLVLQVGRVEFEDVSAAAPPREDAAHAGAPLAVPVVIPDAVPDPDADPDADPAPDPDLALTASPARAHLAIPAGESPTIHDPGAGPTALRIDFGDSCPGNGVVTVRGGRRPSRYAGTGSAIVLLAPGRNAYAIDCAGGPDPRGGVVVLRADDGTTRLSSIAPRNVVDADGRTYDVLYQNALPIFTLRWREGGGRAVLHVVSGARERTVPAPGARAELGSGELGEGTHRVWFAAGERRSPETTIRIRFDNAAPAATLREPSPRDALVPGSTVRVSGSVLPGYTVDARGGALEIDPQLRFASELTVPTDVDSLAVRFSHPRRGVHYYVRRVAGR